MDYVKITHDKLDVAAINDLICDAECGAISFFVGTTRNNFESKKVCAYYNFKQILELHTDIWYI